MNKDKVLIYHDFCPDGFGSRWAFETLYGDTMEYVPMTYGQEIPFSLKNKEVFVADFSFERSLVEKIHEEAKSFVLLDHHISAKRNLDDLPYCFIDINRSGAVLSWMYTRKVSFEDVPMILKLIEDRDIHKWEIEDSGKMLSYLDSLGFDLNQWSDFDSIIKSPEGIVDVKKVGMFLDNFKKTSVNSIAKKRHKIKIDGHVMWACNASFLHSNVANSLVGIDGYDIGCSYYFDGKKYIISLRSLKKNEKIDVSLIAGKFGGGGHKAAAGFSVSVETFYKFLEV
jgi:oligoribonuclease NrnB/cAMP/cGMP phosphodiesterase (DHH superfamily)